MSKKDFRMFNFFGEEPHIYKNKQRQRMVDFESKTLDSKFLGEEIIKYLENIFAGESIFINEEALDYLVGTKLGLEVVKYAVAKNVKGIVEFNNESNSKDAYLLSNGSANVFGIREDNYLALDLYSPVDTEERIKVYKDLTDYINKKTYPIDGNPVFGFDGELFGYIPTYGGPTYQERLSDEYSLEEYKNKIALLTDEEELFKGVGTSFDNLSKYFGIEGEIHNEEPITIPKDVLSRTLIKQTKNTRVYSTKQNI